MTERPSRDLVKENFFDAVRAYIDSGVSVEGMAVAIQKDSRTIRRWLCRRSSPRLPEIERICGLLGWTYAGLLAPTLEVDRVFTQEFANFQALSHRLMARLNAHDAQGVNEILCYLASLLYNRLRDDGLPCQIHIDETCKIRINFTLSKLRHYVLSFRTEENKGAYVDWADVREFTAQEQIGMILRGVDPSKYNRVKPFPLTDEGAQLLIVELVKIRDKEINENSAPIAQDEVAGTTVFAT